MQERWVQRHVVEPARALIESTPIGGEVVDLERLVGPDGLCLGIEGTFRDAVWSEYAPWSPEHTTDGFGADLCVRTGPAQLDVVGLCVLGFTGTRFPLRAAISLTDDLAALAGFVAWIGDVDERTGAPPHLSPSVMVLPEPDGDGRNPAAKLVVRRRPEPIAWTQVFSIDASYFDR